MKKQNIILCFAMVLLYTCMCFALRVVSAHAEDQISDVEEITEAFPEKSDSSESLTDTSEPETPPIEIEEPDTEVEETKYCEKCASPLREDGTCPLCDTEDIGDSGDISSNHETTPFENPDAPDDANTGDPDVSENPDDPPTGPSENTVDSDPLEDIIDSIPPDISEDDTDSESTDISDNTGNAENENEAGCDGQPDEESHNEDNIDEGTELAVQNAPSFFISIPGTVCSISPDEKCALLTIDVNCVDGFKDGDRLDLSFSSANDMILICDNLDSIDYILRDTNGEPASNHATVASFSENGSAELSVEIAGEPSYAGEYRDVLTFTATFVPGAAEQN